MAAPDREKNGEQLRVAQEELGLRDRTKAGKASGVEQDSSVRELQEQLESTQNELQKQQQCNKDNEKGTDLN